MLHSLNPSQSFCLTGPKSRLEPLTYWAWVAHSATRYCSDSETRNRLQTYWAVVQKPSAAILTPAPLWLMHGFQNMTQIVLRKPEHHNPPPPNKPRALSLYASPEVVPSFFSCSCSKLISSFLSCPLLGNGTWNDQHTFPLGGQTDSCGSSFAFLVSADKKGNRVNWWHRPGCVFIPLKEGCVMPGFTRGSHKAKAKAQMKRGCVCVWGGANKVNHKEENINSGSWSQPCSTVEIITTRQDLYYKSNTLSFIYLKVHSPGQPRTSDINNIRLYL